MHNLSNRQVIAFNKKGDKAGSEFIPELIYLQTEKEWIEQMLLKQETLDGVVLLIDWDKKELKIVRYANE